MTNTKPAVCYIRTTNETPDSKILLAEIQAYCQKNNFLLLDHDVFIDENISGSVPLDERIGLKALVERIKRDDKAAVIVYRLDQVFRNMRMTLEFTELLSQHDTGIVSVKECIDTSSPAGRLMLQITHSISEHERWLLKNKCKCGECCCCVSRLSHESSH